MSLVAPRYIPSAAISQLNNRMVSFSLGCKWLSKLDHREALPYNNVLWTGLCIQVSRSKFQPI